MPIPKQPKKTNVNYRTSTITNAFYAAILPFNRFTKENIEKRLINLSYSMDDINNEKIDCIYCGDKSNTWDHLYPLITESQHTGYFHDITNMVPSCNTCNSSKGSKDYREWLSITPRINDQINPNMRKTVIERIDKSVKEMPPLEIEKIVDEVLSSEIGKQYLNDLKEINRLLIKNSAISNQIREMIAIKVKENS